MFTAFDPNSNENIFKEFEKLEFGRSGESKGFKNEQKVVSALVEYSQLKDLGLKIFPGIDVNYNKAKALSGALQPNDVYYSQVNQMEIDIVAIGKSAIYLFETKSSQVVDVKLIQLKLLSILKNHLTMNFLFVALFYDDKILRFTKY